MPKEWGGQAAVAQALKAVACGSSLQDAERDHGAPYASLHRAWVALGGQEQNDTWKAYVDSSPPPAPPVAAQAPSPTPIESPLGPRLARRANRCGDGVPYGKHGPWGMFREGVKELTDKIDKGKISPAAASAQLQAEGVIVSARTLEEKSRMAPGGPSGRPVWRYHQRRIRCAQ